MVTTNDVIVPAEETLVTNASAAEVSISLIIFILLSDSCVSSIILKSGYAFWTYISASDAEKSLIILVVGDILGSK